MVKEEPKKLTLKIYLKDPKGKIYSIKTFILDESDEQMFLEEMEDDNKIMQINNHMFIKTDFVRAEVIK